VLDLARASDRLQAGILLILANSDTLLYCISGIAMVLGSGGNSLNLTQNVKTLRQDRYLN